jgi:hypothetical protein
MPLEGVWAEGCVEALCISMLGISVDLILWVGRLPRVVYGRGDYGSSGIEEIEYDSDEGDGTEEGSEDVPV